MADVAATPVAQQNGNAGGATENGNHQQTKKLSAAEKRRMRAKAKQAEKKAERWDPQAADRLRERDLYLRYISYLGPEPCYAPKRDRNWQRRFAGDKRKEMQLFVRLTQAFRACRAKRAATEVAEAKPKQVSALEGMRLPQPHLETPQSISYQPKGTR